MKERGILFSAPMVRAILEGRKTQTRRPCGDRIGQPDGVGRGYYTRKLGSHVWESGLCTWHCPQGKPGDRLWVREGWRIASNWDEYSPSDLQDEAGYCISRSEIRYLADGDVDLSGRDRRGIFMPRWVSRITLEITDVRIERVQEISETDALEEGVFKQLCGSLAGMREMQKLDGGSFYYDPDTHAAACSYAELWDSINGKNYPWSSNPWCWVISFRKV